MNGRRILCLSIALLASGAFGVSWKMSKTAQATAGNSLAARGSLQKTSETVELEKVADRRAEAKQGASPPPPDVMYGILFRTVSHLNKKADDLASQGKDSSFLRNYYRNLTKLDESESKMFDQVTADAEREIEKLDSAAEKIIAAERAKHPKGKLNPGEAAPQLPQALKELDAQRTATILRARERLRQGFGDAEFQRFEGLLTQDAGKTITVVAKTS
jgi:hypothetical protein